MSIAKLPWRSSAARLSAVIMLVSLLIVACGATTPPSDSPATGPATRPTPRSTPDPAPLEPTPIPSAAADPAVGLAIGQPYTIRPVDPSSESWLLTTFRTALQEEMTPGGGGTTADLVQLALREVAQGDASLGSVYLIAVPEALRADPSHDRDLHDIGSALREIGDPAGDLFVDTRIASMVIPVRRDQTVGGTALVQVGDRLLMVVTRSEMTIIPIVTSLIEANR